MPPKKRPIKKTESVVDTETVDEVEAQPAKIKRTRKNETEKQEDDVKGKPKERKKIEIKKDNELELPDKKVSRKRGAHLPSEDFQSDNEETQEPDKKRRRANKKETTQKPTENSNKDEADVEEKQPKKTEKKTKKTKVDNEVLELEEDEKKVSNADIPSDSEETEEPNKRKRRVNKKETVQKPNENSNKDGEEQEDKKPKKSEKRTKQTKGDKDIPEEEKEKKPKKTETKNKQTKDKEVAEKVVKNNKDSKTEKKNSKKPAEKVDEKSKPDKGKKTTEKKEKAAKKEPTKKNSTETEKKTSNETKTDWEEIDFACDKKNAEGDEPNLKITSWNVDGLRAWLKKDGMNIFQYCLPDILCLQETKCNEELLPSEITDLEGYEKFWCSSDKNGYAGVGLLTKQKPIEVTYGINNEEQDEDGRCITVEFDKYYLVTVYVPNAGRKLVTLEKRLQWNEAFKNYVKELDKKKPVIICGDMNVAHNEIDLKNPKTNTKNAGFTKEERDGMSEFLEEGFVDTFRALYPDKEGSYTFWTYMMNSRKKNVGWRLDYFIVSERIKDKVCDSVMHTEVFGSDHCPVTLFMNI